MGDKWGNNMCNDNYTEKDIELLKKNAKFLNLENVELGYGLSLENGKVCETKLEPVLDE